MNGSFEPVSKAIEAGYRAFEKRPPQRIDGCPDCVGSVGACRLLVQPLRDLDVSDLDRYAFKAMTTVGTPEDFRYFWPRLAELAIGGELLTNIEIVFSKLTYGRWQTWPGPEQDALNRLAESLGARFASDVLYDADDWLCALGLFVRDVRPHLQHLLAETAQARENLMTIYETNERLLPFGALQNAFWDDSDSPEPMSPDSRANLEAIVAFLRSDRVLEALTA